MSNIIRAKCLVIGDSTAGKTSLVQKFISEGNQFPKNYNMTLGLDIVTKMINVPDTNSSVELYLYDCSGKEFYRNFILRVSSQPSLLMLVYDVTSENSFNCLMDLYEQKDHSGVEDPFFFLVNEWFKIYTDKTQALKLLA